MEALTDLICSGVMERFPKLKVIIAETGVGWVPFFLQELDQNYQYFGTGRGGPLATLPMLPSEYFYRQAYLTFMDDTVGGLLSWRWGTNNFLWSNDYPHPNSIWPGSSEILDRTLGHLPAEARARIVCDNVAQLYHRPVPEPLQPPEGAPERMAWSERLQRSHRSNL